MKDRVKASKFLSLVLRHQPETIGIELDAQGWVRVSDLLVALANAKFPLSLDELEEIVRTSDKKRFAFSEDGKLIRANQGHSMKVELGYEQSTPPPVLFHGTAERFVASIQVCGLIKGQRHHVHLSSNAETAISVGRRYGKPVLLTIASERMNKDGHLFFRSANNVWLTDHVPAEYIEFPVTDGA